MSWIHIQHTLPIVDHVLKFISVNIVSILYLVVIKVDKVLAHKISNLLIEFRAPNQIPCVWPVEILLAPWH